MQFLLFVVQATAILCGLLYGHHLYTKYIKKDQDK